MSSQGGVASTWPRLSGGALKPECLEKFRPFASAANDIGQDHLPVGVYSGPGPSVARGSGAPRALAKFFCLA